MLIYEYSLFNSKIIKRKYFAEIDSISGKCVYRLYATDDSYQKTIYVDEINNPTTKRHIYYSFEADDMAYDYFKRKLYNNILKSRLAENVSVTEYRNFILNN